jgi:hypothetical protein
MAKRHQIIWVTKSSGTEPHERIAYVGGLTVDGRVWRISQASAVRAIETGTWDFFISVDGREVDVALAMSKQGHAYIKAETDRGDQPDALLVLPDISSDQAP